MGLKFIQKYMFVLNATINIQLKNFNIKTVRF